MRHLCMLILIAVLLPPTGYCVAVDSSGNVYAGGRITDNVFKITASSPPVPALSTWGLGLLTAALIGTALWWNHRRLEGTHA